MVGCLVIREMYDRELLQTAMLDEGFSESREWDIQSIARLFTCLLCQGRSNSCSFFDFQRSKQTPDFFQDASYFSRHIKIHKQQHKEFQFYFYYLFVDKKSKYDWFLKKEGEREIEDDN